MTHLIRCAILLSLVFLWINVSAYAQRDLKVKWLARRPPISKVEISGNRFFDDGRIRDEIRSQANGFWQSVRLRGKHQLRKDSKRVDMAAVTYLYKSNGFLFVEVEEEFEIAEDSSAIVKISITENDQFFVRNSMTTSELGSFREEVDHHLRQHKIGEPIDLYEVNQTRYDIKTVYANSGYPYAEVVDSVAVYEDIDSVDIVFKIDRGPLTLFGDVVVDSLKFTRPHTFTREILFEPGDIYSRQKIIDSKQRIYSTGLASFVDLSVIEDTAQFQPGKYDVRPNFKLKVSERKPKFAKVRTGAGQDQEEDLVWDVGFEFGNRNISGRARQVRFELLSSFLVFKSDWRVIKERFAFDYTEPWLFKIRMPLTFNFAAEPGIRARAQDYRISRINLGLSSSRELSRYQRIWGAISYEKVNITGIPENQLEQLKEEEGISVYRRLAVTWERDTRNNLLLPVSGTLIRFMGEHVGGFLGGDNHFEKLEASVARYQNFSGSNIYAWHYRAGWAFGSGSNPYVPTTDRFYMGGAKTIRGYRANEVGPKDERGRPVGGRVLIQSNQEIRRPLFWKLWGSIFIDVGNNYDDWDDIRIDNLLVSGGAGVQYISPVGPIRIDYGHRLIHPGYPKDGRFHLSILYAF